MRPHRDFHTEPKMTSGISTLGKMPGLDQTPLSGHTLDDNSTSESDSDSGLEEEEEEEWTDQEVDEGLGGWMGTYEDEEWDDEDGEPDGGTPVHPSSLYNAKGTPFTQWTYDEIMNWLLSHSHTKGVCHDVLTGCRNDELGKTAAPDIFQEWMTKKQERQEARSMLLMKRIYAAHQSFTQKVKRSNVEIEKIAELLHRQPCIGLVPSIYLTCYNVSDIFRDRHDDNSLNRLVSLLACLITIFLCIPLAQTCFECDRAASHHYEYCFRLNHVDRLGVWEPLSQYRGYPILPTTMMMPIVFMIVFNIVCMLLQIIFWVEA